MKNKKTEQKEQIERNTNLVIAWLKTEIGQMSLDDIKRNFPNFASNPISHIGFALGKHAPILSFATIDKIDVLKVAKEILGYVPNASEMGRKGGSLSKGGGRKPKADADPRRRERYLRAKKEKLNKPA